MRTCDHCGAPLKRRAFSTGRMEPPANFAKRRFCDKRCAGQRPMPSTRRCSRCALVQPLESFKRLSTGRPASWCRRCEAAYARAVTQADPASARRIKSAAQRRRRERVLSQDGGQAAAEYARVLACDPCCYCGRPAEHIDHIDALSVGGSGDWTNLTAACCFCNGSKHAKSLLAFLIGRRIVNYEGNASRRAA